MPDTIYTPDGKMRTPLGSTTLEESVRTYAGSDAADRVRWEIMRNAYEEARANSDLEAYEEEVTALHQYIRGWVDDLRSIVEASESRKVTKRVIATALGGVIKNMESI